MRRRWQWLRQVAFYYDDLRYGAGGLRDRARGPMREVGGALGEWFLAAGALFVLCYGLFGFARLMWLGYASSPVGQDFIATSGSRAAALEHFFGLDRWLLSGALVGLASAAGIAAGMVAKLVLLKRYLYDPLGVPGRWVVWGVPAAVAAGLAVVRLAEVGQRQGILLALLPTLLLLDRSVALGATLAPDGGALLAAGYRLCARSRLPWLRRLAEQAGAVWRGRLAIRTPGR